ncbi:MAG: hypothetical protein JNN07_22870 [Verrucomicrobiales bacterium]|nr:hypothetical protein [Verrucomicrobiales bacterium]
MHAKYEAMIDGIDYRTIEAYLLSPTSPIHYIIHAREREMLPELAAYLETAIQQGKATPADIRGLLLPRIDRGDLLVTATRPLLIQPERLVPTAQIPADSYCHVIYMPPFYISHTEGIFESMKLKLETKPEVPRQGPRIKP